MCGVVIWRDYDPPHYSGNFWDTPCIHLRSLSLVSGNLAVESNYYGGKFWISLTKEKDLYVCLDR